MKIRTMTALIGMVCFSFGFVCGPATALAADPVQIAGVTFPPTKLVEGKTLTLNGVALRKALGFVKVYVAGFYVEHPSRDGAELIDSEQIKYIEFHYLTGMATAKKLQNGFIDEIKKCNAPEVFTRNKADVDLYASWLDKDMKPGLTSVSTYVPGKGLTLEYQGVVKGTITNKEFVTMYYNYNLGEKADKKIRKGFLGL